MTVRKQTAIPAAILAAFLGVSATAFGGGGGVGSPKPPKVKGLICVSRCAGVRKAAVGSRVELSGNNLATASKVSFAKRGGGRVKVTPSQVGAHRVIAPIPHGAASGKPRLHTSYRATARSPVGVRIVARSAIPSAGSFRLKKADASPHATFFDGRSKPRLKFIFRGDGATDIRIDVVSRDSGAVVKTFRKRSAEPFTENTATWDGRTSAGAAAPSGRYRFRLGPAGGGTLRTTNSARFRIFPNEFPLRAKHSYGDGFGAGRGHQGQDVMAACGKRIVAARGGRVKFRKFHSAAGNYVVIAGNATKLDYMYAHLKFKARVKVGQRVRTGTLLGYVGQTGDATACHLHFELWHRPWQQGGSPLSTVGKALRRWDRWS